MRIRIVLAPAACAVTLSFALTSRGGSADVVATWSAAVSGTWDDDANWTNAPGPDVFPNNGGSSYDAVIDAAGGPYTVTLSSDIVVEGVSINSADATLELQSGTLTANAGIALSSGVLLFNGGGLLNTTVTPAGGVVSYAVSGGNRMDGSTLAGDLLLNQAGGGWLRLQNGSTFTGNASIGAPDGNSSLLAWEQTGTLDGKTLDFDPAFGGALLNIEGDGTLTFGPALIARGTVQIGSQYFVGGTATLVNQGLISSDLAAQTLTVLPAVFTNEGIAEAINGATLTVQSANWSNALTGTIQATGNSILNLSGTYTNAGNLTATDSTVNLTGNYGSTGTITVTNSILNLGGVFSLPGLGTVNRTGGAVNIQGDLDNTGGTLALNATSGDWSMEGGRIIGGTITQADGAKLLFSTYGSRLDGALLADDLVLDQPGTHHYVHLQNGASFSGDAFLGTPDGYQSILGYEQTGTLDSKTLNLDGLYYNSHLSIDGDNTLTFGPDLVARGGGSIGHASFVGGTSTLVNQGLISADITGQTMNLTPSVFANEGIAEAINGATLTVQAANWTNAATGTMKATGAGSILNWFGNYSNAGSVELTDSTLNLHGTFTTAGLGVGSFTRSGSTVVNIIGDLDNTGGTFALNATTGDWTMLNGRIIGGTITEADGAKLLFEGTNNRLDGALLDGDLNANQDGFYRYVLFQNGASFTGDAHLGTSDGNATVVGFEQTVTLDDKTLNFDPLYNNAYLSIDGDNTVTFGPDLVARGAAGIGQAHFIGGISTLVNQGLISSDMAGQTTTINPSVFTNEGIVEAINGATLTVQATDWTNTAAGTIRATGAGAILNFHGNYTNAGSIVLADGTLNLHGTFTTAGLGVGGFSRSGASAVNLIGDLDNTGGTLALTATTGDWNLAGGRILGGQITQSGGARLIFTHNSGNRLDGVALQDELDLTDDGGSAVRFENGASFAGNAHLGTTTGIPSHLAYYQTGTLDARTLNMDPVSGAAYLSIEGDNVLTFGPTLIARGAGQIGSQFVAGGTNGLVNQGLISADIAGQTLYLTGIESFNNTGTVQATGGGTMLINNALTNLSAGILTGGQWKAFADSTLWFYPEDFSTNAADLTLSGANSLVWLTPSQTPLESLLTANTISGALRLLGGRDYTTNAFANAGVIQLGGGTFTPSSLTNSGGGQLFGFGTVGVRPVNSGTIRSAGGVLAFADGIQSAGGTVQVDSGSSINVSAGTSVPNAAGLLIQNGGLNVGSKVFNVTIDYTNAAFGSGNTFNPRANVSGSGPIQGIGTIQWLSGNVTAGTSSTPVMAFGNVHVGDSTTLNYVISNPMVVSARLRGAIQTTVSGGNLTDPRLGGSGVVAGNFGPISSTVNSGNLPVTFNATTAGALTGQAVRLRNTFNNVTDQTLSITGSAYRYAVPSAHSPAPVAFGNFHVGRSPLPSQLLTISNQATNDGFSESLNASIGGTTGGVNSNGGSFTALTPGSSNGSSLSVNIGTGSAGSKNGTATITLTSNGAGSSDLGLTSLTSQTVTVTGSIYRYAQPTLPGGGTLDFGIVHPGDLAQQTVSVSNSVANDGFSESLDGSFSASSGHITGTGSFTALAPGSTSGAPVVTLDTTTAGSKAGTATFALVSNGTGSSGLGNTTLTSQVVTATGQVNHYAAPAFTRDSGAATLVGGGNAYTVNFGRRTIGETLPAVTLRLTNGAAAPADTLAGSFASVAPDFTLSGFGAFSNVAAGQSQTNLIVSLQTDSLGTFSQTVTLNGLSQNSGGFSGALAPIVITLTGEVTVAPSLKIQLVGLNSVLSWPLAEQSWILKRGNNLTGWSIVADPVVDTLLEHTVTTPRGGDPLMFFRLEK